MRTPLDPVPASVAVAVAVVVAVIALLMSAFPAVASPVGGPTAAPAVAPAAAPAVAPDGTAPVDADAALADYGRAQPSHAVAAALVRDGEATFVATGEDATGAPVSEHTPFRIASMSKSFTAAVVLQLADEGRVDLDGALADALPGFSMADERAGAITIRQLLSHTSGLGMAGYDEYVIPPPADGAGLLEDLRTTSLVADPGTRYEYFNTNFALAAALVEHVEGRTFDEVLHDRILAPLGMADTFATVHCESAEPGLGTGHAVAFGAPLPLAEAPGFCLGSGGVVSTTADVVRWLAFQAGDGSAPGGARILTAESLAEAHRAQPATDGASGGGYGLGWQVGETGGLPTVSHGGALVTWSSHMTMLVDADGRPTGTAAVALSDTAGAPSMLAERLVVEAGGATPAPFESDPRLVVDLVLAGVAVLVTALGLVGVVRARSWPARRRRTWTRVAGLVWPVLVVALGVWLAPLAGALLGTSMGFVPIWWYGAGMMPLLVPAAASLVLAGTAVLVARLVRLAGARRDGARSQAGSVRLAA